MTGKTLTLEQFLHSTADKGDAVNLVFEQRLFDPVGVLHKITGPLAAGDVPHELIGGLAVLIHMEEADPAHSMLTRDVDAMIRRSDIGRVIKIAEGCGFKFRHAAGVDVLLHGNSAKTPIQKGVYGEHVAVISLAICCV